jgi:hypothetical protein
VNGHLLKVVDGPQKLGVEVVGTFVGNDKDRPLTENLERFARIWPEELVKRGFLLARNTLRPLIV